MPAPPDGSEPAIVRTAGAATVEDMANALTEVNGTVRRSGSGGRCGGGCDGNGWGEETPHLRDFSQRRSPDRKIFRG